jgi:protein FrlC
MKLFDWDRLSAMNVHYVHYSLDYFLDCQAKLGIKNVELLGARQGLWMDPYGHQDPVPIREKLQSRNIACQVFTPDNCCYGYQFAVREPESVRQSFRYFSEGIRFGAALGAKILGAHSGWGYWDEPEDAGFARAVMMLKRLSEVAGEHGMRLSCESLRPEETLIGYRLEQIKRLFDAVGHPNFKLMIDLTAISVSGERLEDWFSAFGAKNIIHCHFQDGNPYGHMVWGDGRRNLRRLLEIMREKGYTGLFTQELTDVSYYDDPYYHDQRNVRVLRMYFQ